MKNFRIPIIIFLTFWLIGLLFWQSMDRIFYLFNFGYIGTSVGVGMGLYNYLPRHHKQTGRRLAQFLVGSYMLVFLGLINKENMQIEGFFFNLLSGFFAGAVIHYLVGKVFGPLLFGRAFCGWSCWTAMILDLLPYKINRGGRLAGNWEFLRYLHFGVSLLLVVGLWYGLNYRSAPVGNVELTWLIVGNLAYFSLGITLAIMLRDNRAFCKYICPITAILKISSRFALLKIGGDREKCTGCGICRDACLMDIEVDQYICRGERVLSTECVFCLTCTTVCPKQILSPTFQCDLGGREQLVRQQG